MEIENQHQKKLSTAFIAQKQKLGAAFNRIADKVGFVEQTRFSPEFKSQTDNYMKYQAVAYRLVNKLEACLQMNPAFLTNKAIEAPEKQDPYEDLGRSIKHFRSAFPEDQKPLLVTAEALAKRLAIMQRETQSKGRRTLQKLRHFVSTESVMLENQEKLAHAFDVMDSARRDLKQTTTMEEVKEKGKSYEMAVLDFDMEAEKIINACDNLAQNKFDHQREVLDFFDVCAQNHQLISTLLGNHLEALDMDSKNE